METANIFPVFGQLHCDGTPEPSADAPPCGRTPRRAFPNEAGLFLVSPETKEQSDDSDEMKTAPIKFTGEVAADLATALYCLAFLAEFFNALESNDLRRIADEIEARQ